MTARLSPQRETEIRERWSGIPSSERFGLSVTDTTRPGTLLNALLSAPADVNALRAELAAVRAERDEARAQLAAPSAPKLPSLSLAEQLAHETDSGRRAALRMLIGTDDEFEGGAS